MYMRVADVHVSFGWVLYRTTLGEKVDIHISRLRFQGSHIVEGYWGLGKPKPREYIEGWTIH